MKEGILRNMDKVIENCGGIDKSTCNIDDGFYGFSLWLNNGDVITYGTTEKINMVENYRIFKRGVGSDG